MPEEDALRVWHQVADYVVLFAFAIFNAVVLTAIMMGTIWLSVHLGGTGTGIWPLIRSLGALPVALVALVLQLTVNLRLSEVLGE